MTQLSISFKGADLVRKGLQDLSAEVPKIGKQQIWRMEQEVVRRMKVYPPERINQKYIRTGDLGRGWTITPTSNGYKISNNVQHNGRYYTKYVVGNAYGLEQAWMHVSTDQGKRWNVLREVNEEEVKKLPPEIEKEISMVARSKGL